MTADIARLEAWAEEFAGCNWGVGTGQASGVFVLDVDGEPGEDSLRKFEAQELLLPPTLSVSTGRGRHLYFKLPHEITVRNSNGTRLAVGLDVRGEGGLAVIPTSEHKNGTRYSYTDPRQPIVVPPDWLLQRVAVNDRQRIAANRNQAPYLRVAEYAILPETLRNDGLMRYAGALHA